MSNFKFELVFHSYAQFFKIIHIGPERPGFFYIGQIGILGFWKEKTSNSRKI